MSCANTAVALAVEWRLHDHPPICPANSSGVLMVIAQEPAESPATSHRPLPASFRAPGDQQDVRLSLTVPFTMVGHNILVHRPTQSAFAEEMIFDRHSSLIDLIHRSAQALDWDLAPVGPVS